MAAIFAASYVLGVVLLVASIGNDALGIGMAAVLVAIGGAGKAYVDRRTTRKVDEQHVQVVDIASQIRADIVGVRSDVSRIETDLGQRLTALEDAITAPGAPGR